MEVQYNTSHNLWFVSSSSTLYAFILFKAQIYREKMRVNPHSHDPTSRRNLPRGVEAVREAKLINANGFWVIDMTLIFLSYSVNLKIC